MRSLTPLRVAVLGLSVLLVWSSKLDAADSGALQGIHWWGYDGSLTNFDPTPAALLNSAANGAWDTEVVQTHGASWQKPQFFQPLLKDLYTHENMTVVTRIEYNYQQTVPAPTTIDLNTWAKFHVVNSVNMLKDYTHIWQLGNEPNLTTDASGWTNNQITPSGYAQVYTAVRNAVDSSAFVGAPGAHQVLVAPASPGSPAGQRWMDGTAWLDGTISALQATGTTIDGFALHAYGGSVSDFRASLAAQIAVIDNHGLTNVPLYITEWDKYANPLAADAASQEAASANFVTGAFAAVDTWNKTPGNHNIRGMNWFVYDPGDPAGTPPGTGQWDGDSIKYWKDHGNPQGSSGDLYTAYQQASAHGYAAGVTGSRPLPTGVVLIDNFELNQGLGHFNKSLTFASSSSRFGFITSQSTVGLDSTNSFAASTSEKLHIVDDPNDSRGWQVRHVSGDSTPSTNTRIPLSQGSHNTVGFFYNTTTGGITTQIVLDNNGLHGQGSTNAGVLRSLIGDGQWHEVEWQLDNPGDFTAFALDNTSTGMIATSGYVTINSIMFYGPNANADIYFDGVGYDSVGSLGSAMFGPLNGPSVPVPEPSTAMLLVVGSIFLLLHRKGAMRRTPAPKLHA